MNAVTLILDGYKKLFSGPNAILKHISLFALVSIFTLFSLYFEKFEHSKFLPSDLSTSILGIICMLAVAIYLCGYTYNFMHNAFSEQSPELLPDIDLTSLGPFLKALPLMIVWIIYLTVFAIIASIFAIIAPILGILLLILFFLMATFLIFVFIAFSEYFDAKGLFNVMLPFRFITPSIGMLVLLGILFIPVGIISIIPGFIIGIVLYVINAGDSQIPTYLIAGAVSGYLGFVAQLVWYYCLVQVYKEKLRPIMLEKSTF